MVYTIALTEQQILATCLFVFVSVLIYIWVKYDSGQTRVERMRDDLEARKEWFRLLAEQKKLEQNKK
jgi:hypothetical protein